MWNVQTWGDWGFIRKVSHWLFEEKSAIYFSHSLTLGLWNNEVHPFNDRKLKKEFHGWNFISVCVVFGTMKQLVSVKLFPKPYTSCKSQVYSGSNFTIFSSCVKKFGFSIKSMIKMTQHPTRFQTDNGSILKSLRQGLQEEEAV